MKMSADWLRDHARREPAPQEHHVPQLQWPVKKILNESPLWNRHKLSREREERSA